MNFEKVLQARLHKLEKFVRFVASNEDKNIEMHISLSTILYDHKPELMKEVDRRERASFRDLEMSDTRNYICFILACDFRKIGDIINKV